MLTNKLAQEKYYGNKLLDFGKGKAPEIPLKEYGELGKVEDYINQFEWICDRITEEFNCWLYGIDILVDEITGDFFIIDFNPIPSFSAFKDQTTPWFQFLKTKSNFKTEKIQEEI